ncbi:hypothetical protein [Micromonospora avicenniae]|uniref:DUF4878 domain-containing protein n=1 Tax=Micromonospora avicenniae TaxID=1198245 RepID=A0A1N6WMF6_9ACTN|nr:hypothetical protein [Micromonospora avicenniae]SIQ91263.1 hypothetical protein SAMN05444858_10537 [Micromonospora avicenniae]
MSGRAARVSGVLAFGLIVVACLGCCTRRLSLWSALALGAVAACCAMVWLVATTRRGMAERGPAQATATAYLDAVVAGEFAVAYGLLTVERRAQAGPAEFAELYAGDQAITAYTIDGTTIVRAQGRLHAETHAQVRFANGQAARLLVGLVPESEGRWRVAEVRAGERW